MPEKYNALMTLPVVENRNALAGSVNPSLGLMGGTVNQRMLELYAKDPMVGKYVSDPAQLMKMLDMAAQTRWRERGDAGPETYNWQMKLRNALSEIYGINDYTPRGFQKLNEDSGQWMDPRVFPQIR